MSLETQIEAILFYKSEPVSVSWIAEKVKKQEDEIRDALNSLERSLSGRGIRLVREGENVALATSPEASKDVERITKEELSGDLGKASLETLTVVLYRGPIPKSGIDYIRGVNSSFILRTLLIRGLIERETNPKDKRTFLYRPSMDLLTHLGVARVEDLPEYQEVREEIAKFEKEFKEQNHASESLSE